MVLNELVEKYSLNVISRHTRIAGDYLEALLERNCSKLKRVQAMGFISILEREYGVDLSSIKKECKDYFDAHSTSSPKTDKEIPIFASPDNETSPKEKAKAKAKIDDKNIKAHLNKIVAGLIVIVVAYGSWQLFVPSSLNDINDTTSVSDVDTNGSEGGFFNSVVSIFKSKDKNETNSSKTSTKEDNQVDTKDWNIDGDSDNKSQKDKQKDTTTKPKPKETKKPQENTQENIEAKIIEQVKKEESKKAQENSSQNGGEETPQISDLISSATAGVDDIVDDSKIDTTDALDTEVPSMADDTETTDSGDTTVDETPEPPKPKAKPKPKEEKKKESTKRGKYKTITFHPRSKVWIGYTNLTTMKRAVASGAKDIKLDVSKDSYILATGHGRVEFLSGKKEVLKLGDGKKHFFKISKDGVKEISHEKFQKLNKSKVW